MTLPTDLPSLRPLLVAVVLSALAACGDADPAEVLPTGDPGDDPVVNPPARPDDPAAPFAMLELFTSEGCNTCPAADESFGNAYLAARQAGERIFLIAWHVDYWDYLGWVDPYGDALHTARQRSYARELDVPVGTPWVFMNGMDWSPFGTTNDAVDHFLEEPVDVSTTVWLESAPGAPALDVAFRVRGSLPAVHRLWVVLVERGLTQTPTAGENAGVTLLHQNAARAVAFLDVPPGELYEGSVTLEVPGDLVPENASIVALVQRALVDPDRERDGTTMKVVGATEIDLVPAAP